MILIVLFLILIASALLGYKVISGVPPLLHTPLMSGMNALSGITVLGAIAVFSLAGDDTTLKAGASVALVLAMINVAGGFWVTERMLKMFHKNDTLKKEDSV